MIQLNRDSNLELLHFGHYVVRPPDYVVGDAVVVVAIVHHDVPLTKVTELFKSVENQS